MHRCSDLIANVFIISASCIITSELSFCAVDLEEKAKQDEIEEKQKKNNPAESSDTSDKGNNTKTQDKNNLDPSEKLPDKSKKDTRQDKGTNENDSKTRDESSKATVDDTKPTELQPREQEGNKDPGGGTESQTPGSDAKMPETSSNTDNSQRAQNGECQIVFTISV